MELSLISKYYPSQGMFFIIFCYKRERHRNSFKTILFTFTPKSLLLVSNVFEMEEIIALLARFRHYSSSKLWIEKSNCFVEKPVFPGQQSQRYFGINFYRACMLVLRLFAITRNVQSVIEKYLVLQSLLKKRKSIFHDKALRTPIPTRACEAMYNEERKNERSTEIRTAFS